MPNIEPVRASRDGDQFHYWWAARRCLALLQPKPSLAAISIEGLSPEELPLGSPALAAACTIDVAEYYGSEDLARANAVRYQQLKHSTRRVTKPWTGSELAPTLTAFSSRYRELLQRFSQDDVHRRFEFWFVTNRPISRRIRQAVAHGAVGLSACSAIEITMLTGLTGLNRARISGFCARLRLEDGQQGYLDQRNILIEALDAYLPDSGNDVLLQLKELVSSRATSQFANRPSIHRIDVLRALNTDESRLYPAPCLIKSVANALRREQVSDIVSSIVNANSDPVIVHALAGVGKSAFASMLPREIPHGSAAIVYDCFGDGGYRSTAYPRHHHQEALVQIGNELAHRGLCNPLVPLPHSDRAAYVRKFIERMRQATAALRKVTPSALLFVVLDAADNAEIAADEAGDRTSFARDLLREPLPDGVRLVALCRTHRKDILVPPDNTIFLELGPFSLNESAAHLRQTFPNATAIEAEEFHRLTSSNPRVQAQAISAGLSLPATLASLAPHPTTLDDAMASLLGKAVFKIRDHAGAVGREQIDRVCVGLAALRPPIPISILSQMSNVSEAAIRNFAMELGRPLLLVGQALQFRDEPTETWFREQYKPGVSDRVAFIERLRPLAGTSAYVASALPQLLLEAGLTGELVTLALGSGALPVANEIESRQIELRRCTFALKTSLLRRRYLDAAKLTLKAGGLAASDDRRQELILRNTDLAARFLEQGQSEQEASRWELGTGWRGSHHAYAAGLLSWVPGLAGLAASRLRQAEDWLRSWTRLPQEKREEQRISVEDIAEVALARLLLHGTGSAVEFICSWRPERVRLDTGRFLCSRLIDNGRLAEVNAIAGSPESDIWLVLGAIVELREVHQLPALNSVQRALGLVREMETVLDENLDYKETVLNAITGLVEAATALNACTGAEAASILSRFLPGKPPTRLGTRFRDSTHCLLRAYCLRAELEGKVLELSDLAHPELRAMIERQGEHEHSAPEEVRDFREGVGALLPWHKLWAAALVRRQTGRDLDEEIEKAREASHRGFQSSHREDRSAANEIALAWAEVILRFGEAASTRLEKLEQWIGKLSRPLFVGTSTALSRICARYPESAQLSLKSAQSAFLLTRDEQIGADGSPRIERAQADEKAADFVSIGRAVLPISVSDARGYFNEAVRVASRVGSENLDRWSALIDLATRSTHEGARGPEIAYRFARGAELTYSYVVRDKHFDWDATIKVLAALCPQSTFAILSRWRDRRFGRTGRNLPTAIAAMCARNDVAVNDVLPLIAFYGDWDYPQLCEALLSGPEPCQGATRALWFLSRHVEWDYLSTADLRKLDEICNRRGYELLGLKANVFFRKDEPPEDLTQGLGLTLGDTRQGPDWDDIFSVCDLTSVTQLENAYARVRIAQNHGVGLQDFLRQAVKRVRPCTEPDFVGAVGRMPTMQLRDLEIFTELPVDWKVRPAVRDSLCEALKGVCQRQCTFVYGGRHDHVGLRGMCNTLGVDYRDLVTYVLTAIGETVEDATPQRLFSLIGLLAEVLTGDEAHETLRYGLDLLDPILEPTEGDGPWSENLRPPATAEQSIAGYVYAALASPVGRIRWEAAHSVLGLCALGRHDVLAPLVERVGSGSGGSFADVRLPFYNLHAHQWLLIGLARAALEFPEAVEPFSDRLVAWSLNQRHIMIRAFAARAALALTALASPTFSPENVQKLRNVNRTAFPVVEPRSPADVQETQSADAKDKFFFEPDIGPYWYEPLADVFGLPRSDVEERATGKLRNELHILGDGRWSDDPRARLGLYEERQAWASHGDYPAADNHFFYGAYHALMLVAADLLAERPVHRENDWDSHDPFVEWLSRHDLSRTDGRWLADRRDPAPLERNNWRKRYKGHSEGGGISEPDFSQAFVDGDHWVVWGYWTAVESEWAQHVRVRSALVSPKSSSALLRALSSAGSTYDYRIPSAADELESDVPGFALKGWVEANSRDRGPEHMDPWCGNIRFPPPAPSHEVAESERLETDLDRRVWRDPLGKPILQTTTWGTHRPDPYYDEHPHGEKLVATHGFILKLLRDQQLDLILEVEIQRRSRARRAGWRDKNEREPRKAKLYLLKPDGSIATI